MAFATAKHPPRSRTTSPIRPKSAGGTNAQTKAKSNTQQASPPKPRSPTKGPTPKQNIRPSIDTISFDSGNAGNDVVMQIFEKLHRATGGARSVKKSKNNSSTAQLRKLSTKPSEKILRTQSWKDYFSSNENSNNNSFVSNEKKREPETRQPRTEENNDDNNKDMEETTLDYQKLYHRLVKRINHLWKELHIPLCDRDFYSVGIIKQKFETVSQIDDLSCYVKRLLDHRNDTIQAIHAIRERERVMENCNSLISVALRFYNVKYSTLNDEVARNTKEQEELIEKEQQLKLEIKRCLLQLQHVSCTVIRSIKAWRERLWRPQPFVYRGSNYLTKMKTDMNFLKSKSVERILDTVPIAPRDLICVLFDTENEGNVQRIDNDHVHRPGPHDDDDELVLRGAELEASLVIDETKEHPPLEVNKDSAQNQKNDATPPETEIGCETGEIVEMQMQSPHLHPPRPEQQQGDNRGETGPNSGSNSDADAGLIFMRQLQLVVLQEDNVQRALQMETSALHARGTFIPSLRFELDDESDANLLKKKE